MKKVLLTLLTLLSVVSLSAQPRGGRFGNRGGVTPPPATPSIVVEAQQGETFQVYVGGDLINNVPQSQVTVDNLNNYVQDVIVVLKHPARKAGIIQVIPTMEGTLVAVSYDLRNQRMNLYTQGQANYGSGRPPVVTPPVVTPPTPPTPPTPSTHVNPPVAQPQEPVTVSDAWVDEMVELINRQSFDNERLATAKGLLANGLPFTASQIARIAQTFDFGTAKVDFLKAAYLHCYDRENYERALAVLEFSSDRQKVRSYISKLGN